MDTKKVCELIWALKRRLGLRVIATNTIMQYDDINLGRRNLCTVCGYTYGIGHEPRHSSGCHIGKDVELVNSAEDCIETLLHGEE